MATLVGQNLGQYKVLRLLGEGGMAAVYQAHQESIKRDVAIKVIKPNLIDMDDFAERFHHEAHLVASLSQAHILKVFDYGRHEDIVYLVMELMTGGSLEQLIKNEPLPLNRAAVILEEIASALDYAHQKGVIHRDLKPGNVLLDESGGAFLTDFGLAKLLNSSQKLTQTGTSIGTPAYMAPEQWRGTPSDARTDVYALGVVLYEMLSGALPFKGDSALSMMYLHMHEPPPPLRLQNSAIPLDVETVVSRALAKDPEDRFQSAGGLAAAFRSALEVKTPVPSPSPIPAAAPVVPSADLAATSFVPSSPGLPNAPDQPVTLPPKRPDWLMPAMTGVGVAAVLLLLGFGILSNTARLNTPTVTVTTAPTDRPAPPTERPQLTPPDNPNNPGGGNSGPSGGGDNGPGPDLRPHLLTGHTAAVNSIAFSTDGKFIASGSDDKTARLWSMETEKSVQVFTGHKDAVKSVALSPDSRYLLTASADGTAILWNVGSGQIVRSLSGHAGAVNSAVFSSDGQFVLTASTDESAKLWDTETGNLLLTFSGVHTDALLDAVFSPDGKIIATASADMTGVIWDAQTGNVLQTLKGHTGVVQAIAFSWDGRYLITGSADGTARIWNYQSGTVISLIDNQGQGIAAVTFQPDNRVVITSGQDGIIRAWDPLSGRALRQMSAPTDPVKSVLFAPRGVRFIATAADRTVRLWPLPELGPH